MSSNDLTAPGGGPEAASRLRTRTRGPRRVLLAAGERSPLLALIRASELAEELEAELHVLRVLSPPARSPAAKFVSTPPDSDEFRLLEAVLGCYRETRALSAQVSGRDGGDARIEVRIGSFVDAVAQHAAGLRVMLVVVPAHDAEYGASITLLARTLDLPVLVARPPTQGETILAATDLRDPSYPVLHLAADLARHLALNVIALHNYAPPGAPQFPASSQSLSAEEEDELTDRAQRLDFATSALDAPSEGVVACLNSTVDAILGLARSSAAEVIVVGTRAPSLAGAALQCSVASEVAERAEPSVLVAPLRCVLH